MATTTRCTADDDIKKARARALTYLRREANANRQRALDEAAEAIKRAHIAIEAVDPRATLARVVLDHARDVTEPVLASLGLTPPMNLTTTSDGRPRASTDYTRIDVSMPLNPFTRHLLTRLSYGDWQSSKRAIDVCDSQTRSSFT